MEKGQCSSLLAMLEGSAVDGCVSYTYTLINKDKLDPNNSNPTKNIIFFWLMPI